MFVIRPRYPRILQVANSLISKSLAILQLVEPTQPANLLVNFNSSCFLNLTNSWLTLLLVVIEDPSSYCYIRPEGSGLMVGLFEPDAASWNVDGWEFHHNLFYLFSFISYLLSLIFYLLSLYSCPLFTLALSSSSIFSRTYHSHIYSIGATCLHLKFSAGGVQLG